MSFANVARAVIPQGSSRWQATWRRPSASSSRSRSAEAIGENELRSTIAATLAHVLYERGRDVEAERFACQQECGRGRRRRLAGVVAIGARQGHRAA